MNITVAKPSRVNTSITRAFWESADRGVLLLQHCQSCGYRQLYPRALCTACWSGDMTWVESAGTGVVWTFTVVEIAAHPAWQNETPYVLAIVELDEGPRFLTNVLGCPPGTLCVGERVRLARRDEQRDGAPPLQFVPVT